MSNEESGRRQEPGDDVDVEAALRRMVGVSARRVVRDELRAREVARLSDHSSDGESVGADRIVDDAISDAVDRFVNGSAAPVEVGPACAVPIPVDTQSTSAMFKGAKMELKDWVPQPYDPIKVVCVTIHVFQDADGNGHYTEDDLPKILQTFEWATGMWVWPAAAWTGGVKIPAGLQLCMPYLSKYDGDTRIRFHLANVRFHRSAQFHAAPGLRWDMSQGKTESELMLNHVLDLFPEDASTINVLWNAGAKSYNLNGQTHVNSPHANMGFPSLVYQGLGPPSQTNGTDFAFSQTLAHEFGHSVGLRHICSDVAFPPGFTDGHFDPNDSEYFCDIFGVGTGGPWTPCLQTNNLMEPRGGQWVSRLQSAVVHRALTETHLAGLVANAKPNPCCSCLGAIAFTATSTHSGSGSTRVRWDDVHLDRGFGWAKSVGKGPSVYIAPVSGTYQLDLSFVRDSSSKQFSQPGTTDDVYLAIRVNSQQVAYAWAGETLVHDRDRETGAKAITIELEYGDLVTVDSSSDGGGQLSVFANFSGHLVR